MGDSSVAPKTTVVVTGFGPFGNHIVNASWEAVKEMSKTGISDDVDLQVVKMPVEYETVKQKVPLLWKEHKPKLMVHVGVSGIAKELTLEQQAHNDGYDKLDINGRIPVSKCCVSGAGSCLVSCLDMEAVCREVNQAKCGVHAVVSQDPGRYLCDFIYFTSLSVNHTCTAFIHVPPLNKPYTGQQLAHSIRLAILAMLKQLQ